MSNEVVKKCPWLLVYMPDWFVTLKMPENINNYKEINDLVKWCDDYKQREAQKAQNKNIYYL